MRYGHEGKAQKNPTAAAKTDYNKIWSDTGQFIVDDGISAAGAQPVSISFVPDVFRFFRVQRITAFIPSGRRTICSDPHAVKVQILGKLRNVDAGDTVVVYVSDNTPVYESEGWQQLSTYWAIDILKGANRHDGK